MLGCGLMVVSELLDFADAAVAEAPGTTTADGADGALS